MASDPTTTAAPYDRCEATAPIGLATSLTCDAITDHKGDHHDPRWRILWRPCPFEEGRSGA